MFGAILARVLTYTTADGVNIAEEGKTDTGEGVVSEHGVDRLGELGTARLVDTAGVDPHPLVTLSFRDLAASADLLRDFVARISAPPLATLDDGLYILEALFVLPPNMREDCVAWGRHVLGGMEVVELRSGGMQEPHDGRVCGLVDINNITRFSPLK